MNYKIKPFGLSEVQGKHLLIAMYRLNNTVELTKAGLLKYE